MCPYMALSQPCRAWNGHAAGACLVTRRRSTRACAILRPMQCAWGQLRSVIAMVLVVVAAACGGGSRPAPGDGSGEEPVCPSPGALAIARTALDGIADVEIRQGGSATLV